MAVGEEEVPAAGVRAPDRVKGAKLFTWPGPNFAAVQTGAEAAFVALFRVYPSRGWEPGR